VHGIFLTRGIHSYWGHLPLRGGILHNLVTNGV